MSITIRRAGCGEPRRACGASPPSLHGPAPYIQWTRIVNGKTVTRLLTPAQHQAYAPWFGNARGSARCPPNCKRFPWRK